MLVPFDIWKSLAGIAIFLLGMNFLEDGITHLAGRSFKLFLKKQTTNNLKAIAGGAIVTGILQSSSIVNLMILAFAGTGVIKMRNALGLILGANLGSTFTSWIIVTLGFSFNLEELALPVTAIAGIAMALAAKESKLYHWCKMLLGFGFLFVGLGYIKTGVEHVVLEIDLQSFNDQPAVVFLLTGFFITALIQSSSATMAITLSALHANAIDLATAMTIVLGAEAGTAIKLIIAAIKGSAPKKRLAMGNLLFNVISTLILFFFISPIHTFITRTINIQNDLVALVFFQSFVNLAGIIAFYPFLNPAGRFLEKQFRQKNTEGLFLSKSSAKDTDAASRALEMETGNFIYHVLGLAASAFQASYSVPPDIRHRKFEKKPVREKYEYIKTLHGEIQRFAIESASFSSAQAGDGRTDQLISAVRNSMYAAKNIMDAYHDIEQLRNSSNDIKYGLYKINRDKMINFCGRVGEMLSQPNEPANFNTITDLYKEIQAGYTESLRQLYNEVTVKNVNQTELSTLINMNREMYTAFKSLVFSVKDYVLNEAEADRFDELPGFIR